MIKAILLVFDSARTWDSIAEDKRSVSGILFTFLLPLLLLTSAAEGYGLMTWGKRWVNQVLLETRTYTLQEVITYEVVQLLVALVVVFVGAVLVKALGETFHGRHSYTQTFTAVAYGLSPLFLLRLLDAFPVISPWLSWGVGMALSAMILYHGIPRVMMPDPPHAFGLFLTSTLLLTITTALTRFITYLWLQGKFKKVDVMFSEIIGRLQL